MRQRISGLIAPGAILVAAVASLVFLSTAAAEGPAKGKLHSAHTSDNRDTLAEKSTFNPETPKVYVTYTLDDVQPGQKIKVVWIAEKAEGVVENSKIAESVSTATTMINGLFSYSKPPKGWPAGTYRIELYVENALDKTLRFKVVKP